MPKKNQALICARDISLSYGNETILEQVNISVYNNEIVTLIGPNGAGKSSLIKILLGLKPATLGQVIKNPALKVGYMPQSIQLNHYMPISVGEFLRLNQAKNQALPARILSQLAIQDILETSIHNLSGGEFQRVLLARALLAKPKLLVLDEPAQGVDLMGQDELYRIIKGIRDQERCGVLMVSHDLHLVMAETDRVICLNRHVCCMGSPESVQQEPSFKSIFGIEHSKSIGIYAHRHSHRHDVDGSICN